LRPISACLRSPHRRRSNGVVLQRLSRHGPAPQGVGGNVGGAEPNRSRRRRHPQHLGHQPRLCAARTRTRGVARTRGGLSLYLGLCRQRGSLIDVGGQHARHGRVVGRDEPCLDDRRYPQQSGRAADLPPQRHRTPGGAPRRGARGSAEIGVLRIGLFNGWRHRTNQRDLRCSRSVRRDDLSRRGARGGALRRPWRRHFRARRRLAAADGHSGYIGEGIR
jgi:hypothetical protein